MASDGDPVPPPELALAALALRSHALDRLQELVHAESPSGDAARIDELNTLLTSAFSAAGSQVERRPGAAGDHLVCTWPAHARDPSTPHVLLIGHSDTVLPAGTISARPFRIDDDGDTVTGPGVYDMKGALVQVEIAMRLIESAGLVPSLPVRLVVVSDEEIGSPDGRRVVTRQAQGARAVLGLEPPLPGGALKIGRRGVMRYELAVDGVEAHAGLDPDRGVSAIDELVDQHGELRRAVPTGPDTALNVGLVGGGTGANVVAGRATAQIGVRFRTAAAELRLTQALTGLESRRRGASVTVTRLTHRPAWEPDPMNPVAAELMRLAAILGIPLGTGVSDGAGDTNATGAAGIPTVDGLGPEGGGAHAPTEWASISSLLQRAALLAAYLLTVDPQPGHAPA